MECHLDRPLKRVAAAAARRVGGTVRFGATQAPCLCSLPVAYKKIRKARRGTLALRFAGAGASVDPSRSCPKVVSVGGALFRFLFATQRRIEDADEKLPLVPVCLGSGSRGIPRASARLGPGTMPGGFGLNSRPKLDRLSPGASCLTSFFVFSTRCRLC